MRQKWLDADVIIIGGGPTGIYLSLQLRKKKLKVLVIEKDKTIGIPRFCSGLISKKAYERFELPQGLIQNRLNSAWVLSPLESKLYLKNPNIEVFVVNRTAFDQTLYKKADREGVEFLLDHHCADVRVGDDFVEVEVISKSDKKTIRKKANLCVLATGVNYQLHRRLGLGIPSDFLDCSQAELPYKGFSEIEIYVGNKIAPNSFAWIIPVNSHYVRAGVSSSEHSDRYLIDFINKGHLKACLDKAKLNVKKIVRRPIPLGLIDKTYADRILVIGDAAGQVKPVTGGGLYFGLLCTEIAAEVTAEAFSKTDFSARFLSRYEKRWKKQIGFDLEMGLRMRKLVSAFDDKQIDLFIDFLSRKENKALIEKYADFDHHGKIIKELIKKPLFWSVAYKMLSSHASAQ